MTRFLLCAALSMLMPMANGIAAAATTDGTPDYSAAERLVFMQDHLQGAKPPAALRYTFKKTGSLEPGFEDTVKVQLAPKADGSCCDAKGDVFTGARHMDMPDVPDAKSNPVILYFLERDIREMQRLTKGQANHFRKYIRMAVYEGAVVKEATLTYQGRQVKGQEVTFSPYLTDPNRPRFEKLAQKQYTFRFSDAVPGGVLSLSTQVPNPDGTSAPLMTEELLLDGANH